MTSIQNELSLIKHVVSSQYLGNGWQYLQVGWVVTNDI